MGIDCGGINEEVNKMIGLKGHKKPTKRFNKLMEKAYKHTKSLYINSHSWGVYSYSWWKKMIEESIEALEKALDILEHLE